MGDSHDFLLSGEFVQFDLKTRELEESTAAFESKLLQNQAERSKSTADKIAEKQEESKKKALGIIVRRFAGAEDAVEEWWERTQEDGVYHQIVTEGKLYPNGKDMEYKRPLVLADTTFDDAFKDYKEVAKREEAGFSSANEVDEYIADLKDAVNNLVASFEKVKDQYVSLGNVQSDNARGLEELITKRQEIDERVNTLIADISEGGRFRGALTNDQAESWLDDAGEFKFKLDAWLQDIGAAYQNWDTYEDYRSKMKEKNKLIAKASSEINSKQETLLNEARVKELKSTQDSIRAALTKASTDLVTWSKEFREKIVKPFEEGYAPRDPDQTTQFVPFVSKWFKGTDEETRSVIERIVDITDDAAQDMGIDDVKSLLSVLEKDDILPLLMGIVPSTAPFSDIAYPTHITESNDELRSIEESFYDTREALKEFIVKGKDASLLDDSELAEVSSMGDHIANDFDKNELRELASNYQTAFVDAQSVHLARGAQALLNAKERGRISDIRKEYVDMGAYLMRKAYRLYFDFAGIKLKEGSKLFKPNASGATYRMAKASEIRIVSVNADDDDPGRVLDNDSLLYKRLVAERKYVADIDGYGQRHEDDFHITLDDLREFYRDGGDQWTKWFGDIHGSVFNEILEDINTRLSDEKPGKARLNLEAGRDFLKFEYGWRLTVLDKVLSVYLENWRAWEKNYPQDAEALDTRFRETVIKLLSTVVDLMGIAASFYSLWKRGIFRDPDVDMKNYSFMTVLNDNVLGSLSTHLNIEADITEEITIPNAITDIVDIPAFAEEVEKKHRTDKAGSQALEDLNGQYGVLRAALAKITEQLQEGKGPFEEVDTSKFDAVVSEINETLADAQTSVIDVADEKLADTDLGSVEEFATLVGTTLVTLSDTSLAKIPSLHEEKKDIQEETNKRIDRVATSVGEYLASADDARNKAISELEAQDLASEEYIAQIDAAHTQLAAEIQDAFSKIDEKRELASKTIVKLEETIETLQQNVEARKTDVEAVSARAKERLAQFKAALSQVDDITSSMKLGVDRFADAVSKIRNEITIDSEQMDASIDGVMKTVSESQHVVDNMKTSVPEENDLINNITQCYLFYTRLLSPEDDEMPPGSKQLTADDYIANATIEKASADIARHDASIEKLDEQLAVLLDDIDAKITESESDEALKSTGNSDAVLTQLRGFRSGVKDGVAGVSKLLLELLRQPLEDFVAFRDESVEYIRTRCNEMLDEINRRRRKSADDTVQSIASTIDSAEKKIKDMLEDLHADEQTVAEWESLWSRVNEAYIVRKLDDDATEEEEKAYVEPSTDPNYNLAKGMDTTVGQIKVKEIIVSPTAVMNTIVGDVEKFIESREFKPDLDLLAVLGGSMDYTDSAFTNEDLIEKREMWSNYTRAASDTQNERVAKILELIERGCESKRTHENGISLYEAAIREREAKRSASRSEALGNLKEVIAGHVKDAEASKERARKLYLQNKEIMTTIQERAAQGEKEFSEIAERSKIVAEEITTGGVPGDSTFYIGIVKAWNITSKLYNLHQAFVTYSKSNASDSDKFSKNNDDYKTLTDSELEEPLEDLQELPDSPGHTRFLTSDFIRELPEYIAAVRDVKEMRNEVLEWFTECTRGLFTTMNTAIKTFDTNVVEKTRETQTEIDRLVTIVQDHLKEIVAKQYLSGRDVLNTRKEALEGIEKEVLAIEQKWTTAIETKDESIDPKKHEEDVKQLFSDDDDGTITRATEEKEGAEDDESNISRTMSVGMDTELKLFNDAADSHKDDEADYELLRKVFSLDVIGELVQQSRADYTGTFGQIQSSYATVQTTAEKIRGLKDAIDTVYRMVREKKRKDQMDEQKGARSHVINFNEFVPELKERADGFSALFEPEVPFVSRLHLSGLIELLNGFSDPAVTPSLDDAVRATASRLYQTIRFLGTRDVNMTSQGVVNAVFDEEGDPYKLVQLTDRNNPSESSSLWWRERNNILNIRDIYRKMISEGNEIDMNPWLSEANKKNMTNIVRLFVDNPEGPDGTESLIFSVLENEHLYNFTMFLVVASAGEIMRKFLFKFYMFAAAIDTILYSDKSRRSKETQEFQNEMIKRLSDDDSGQQSMLSQLMGAAQLVRSCLSSSGSGGTCKVSASVKVNALVGSIFAVKLLQTEVVDRGGKYGGRKGHEIPLQPHWPDLEGDDNFEPLAEGVGYVGHITPESCDFILRRHQETKRINETRTEEEALNLSDQAGLEVAMLSERLGSEVNRLERAALALNSHINTEKEIFSAF